MSAPTVSFIVPCYNYGRYLRDCLGSIFNQEGKHDFEIVAVNDASPDDTIDILRSYRDPRLKIIDRRENKGHIFTVNEGFAAASGEYLVRIDPDDRHHPHFLNKTVPVLDSTPHVGLVYGNINIIGREGQLWQERADAEHHGRDFTGNEFIHLLKKNFICAPTVIARREAWMSAWPIPEGLAFNDWYFNLMLARKWQFHYCDDVLADYRVHGANWHSRISRDGSEETSVLWLLNRIYSEAEADPALEAAKTSAKAEVYASQYLDFANKYFGFGMIAEARRCYTEAWRWLPRALTEGSHLRRWLACYLPPRFYSSLKRALQPKD